MSTSTALGALPHWDLSPVYSGLESVEFNRDIAACGKQIRGLERYLDKQTGATGKRPSARAARQVIDGYITRINTLITLYGTIAAFISSYTTTDSLNTTAQRRESEIEPLGVRLSTIDTRFRAWLGALGATLAGALKTPGLAHEHAFYLTEAARLSRFQMSPAEEALAAQMNLSGANAWGKLQGNVVSQLAVKFERNGRTETLSIPALLNVQHHDPDPEVRRDAYEAEHVAWEGVKYTLAAAMNGVKGEVALLGRKRGRKTPLDSALDSARIDRKTLDAMMGAMQDSFPIFRRYLRAKARNLGHAGALPWWDLFAPLRLAGHSERAYTWDDTQAFLLRHFDAFSPRLGAMTRTAFAERWMDAEQRTGKRAGAFCMDVPVLKQSRILCNFDGSLDQVSTVAHELGHAFHTECMIGRTPLQQTIPMTLAETASIFCETIIVDAALDQAGSREEQLAILETDLIGKTQVIVDITSRFMFESEVFARRAKSELSADDLSEIMLRCQKATYGDGLDERYMHKFMWTWKPHYYYHGLSFYNFPYAFGLLFATGLYAIYKQRGQAFVPEYEALLSSSGLADAATVAKRFKIDIRKKAFWQASLDLIGERVARYEALLR